MTHSIYIVIIFPFISFLSNYFLDIYVCSIGKELKVCSKGKYIALVSTTVETSDPEVDLQHGLELLGPISEKFIKVSEIYEPVDKGNESNVFITSSYDATTHFESTCKDVLDIYKRIVGEEFDFSKVKHTIDVAEQE